jgi:hypothetical protein
VTPENRSARELLTDAYKVIESPKGEQKPTVRRRVLSAGDVEPRRPTAAAPFSRALTPMPELEGPQWALVKRIAASRGFERSTLLANFLLFVCHRSLSGEASTINEQQIGVHVFRREAEFNRTDDNIVRNYARMLRKRIDDYFRNEGRDEPLTMHIPRGGYVPLFVERPVETKESPGVEEQTGALDPLGQSNPASLGAAGEQIATPATAESARRRRSRLAMLVAVAMASGVIGFIAARGLPARWLHPENSAEQMSDRFWQQIFDRHRDTFLVPTDGGLVILHNFLQQPVTLSSYISGSYRNEDQIAQGLEVLSKSVDIRELPPLIQKVENLGARRYTSIVDLDMVSRMSRRPEVVPERLMIRYARDLRMDDLKTGNAILIGSVDSNPWVELFQPQLNFQFDYGGSFGRSAVITNRHPLSGERPSYASVTGDPKQRTYGVIAFVPNLDGTGHVLIVEGINMAGTQAAGELLLSSEKIAPVLKRAMKAGGEIRPFEVLLETENIAANSSQSQVISERVGQL